jgi:hypothetical protein
MGRSSAPSRTGWPASSAGHPSSDLDADVIAAYGRHLASAGGRGGRPAAPATVARVPVDDSRARPRPCARRGRRRRAGAAATNPAPEHPHRHTDYANLLRVPDRRTIAGKRDYALLRILGDCGRALSGAPRPACPRSSAARARTPATTASTCAARAAPARGAVPEAVQRALEAWTAVHPLARAVGLLDEQPAGSAVQIPPRFRHSVVNVFNSGETGP